MEYASAEDLSSWWASGWLWKRRVAESDDLDINSRDEDDVLKRKKKITS